ncbi:YceH family protein [Catenovulum sediminis]|uniref:DUF480 domain-containing protein n=1 Tax=Catenovulum sediminis TaxID=1740262 RepID=A0ABV1RER3_9ALTE|nr:DUF480 domain-containing protein [Catenovulum sediminis]
MTKEFSFEQTRLIGVFLEKEKTTPDQYPLSINAMTNACNQKSNRDPVVNFSESQVQNIVDELIKLRVLQLVSSPSARAAKYKHRFCGSDFSLFDLSPAQSAIICLLFLRGAQTPGELRTRTQRLYAFSDVAQVEETLSEMAHSEDPMVKKLPREAGKRESRYIHLFTSDDEIAKYDNLTDANTAQASLHPDEQQRIEQLEQEVAQLKTEIAQIKEALDL